MDDQPPNPTHNNPLTETTSSDEVAGDRKKRETEVDGDDQKKDKMKERESKEMASQETDEIVDDRNKKETEVDDGDQIKKKNTDVNNSVSDSSSSRGINEKTTDETMPGNEKIEIPDQESRADDEELLVTAGNKEGEKVVSSERKSEKKEIQVRDQGIEDESEKKKKIGVDPSAINSSTSSGIHDADDEKIVIQLTELDEVKKENIAVDPTATNSPPKIDKVPVFLFLKELELEDANPNLNRLVIERFKDLITRALATAEEKERDHVRVMTTDSKRVEFELRLMRDGDGNYVLGHQWRDIVIAHGLREGDMVAGWGNLVGDHDEIRMKLDIYETAESRELSDEESREKVVSKNDVDVVSTIAKEEEPMLLFGSKLESSDTNTILNRLVIGFYKDVVNETLTRVKEVKKCDHVKAFMKVHDFYSESDEEYEFELRRYPGGLFALYEFGQIVAAKKLRKGDRVLGWGHFDADDQVRGILRIGRDKNSNEYYIP